jgi:hypothetical protein
LRGSQPKSKRAASAITGTGISTTALRDLPHFQIVDRRLGGMGVAGVAGGIAVPGLHLGEEAEQIGLVR